MAVGSRKSCAVGDHPFVPQGGRAGKVFARGRRFLSPRRALWPCLFALGLLAGATFGLITGLPALSVEAADWPRFGALRSDVARVVQPAEAPVAPPTISARPRIAIVIDDMGLNGAAFERINALPQPITMSFLAYARGAQSMIDALAPQHEAMLHLPMEPLERLDDAGPDMLRVDEPPGRIRAALRRNLTALRGYDGVNNHTGSRFTADTRSMRIVLQELDARGIYFLDSVTTARPVAARLGAQNAYRVIERDVFLDTDYATLTPEIVQGQLALAEAIAQRDGMAIAIGHPYRVTMGAVETWLSDIEARGFEIVTVGDLVAHPSPLVGAD